MRSDNYRRLSKYAVSFAGSALLALILTAGSAHAETNQNANNNPNTSLQQSAASVRSFNDRKALPDNDYWDNPANYKEDVPVQFLGINDLHGNIDTTGKVFTNGMHQNAGGAARLAAYLNHAEDNFKAKNSNGYTFRVEAGDMVGASPATSSLLQDEPTMKALKAMKINIGTLGNHEFDEGLPEFERILVGGQPKKGQFNQIEEAYPHENSGIELVESNLIDTSTGKPPFGWKPYLIKTVKAGDKEVKVGFIGIETTDLPKLTFAKNLKNYKVLDEAESIVKYAKILRDQGVNAIVVLAHTGAATYGRKTTGDAVEIMKKVYRLDPDNSVDLFIAAHSHQYADAVVGKTHLVQAASFSKAYDDVIGYINPKTDDFASIKTHVYPVMSESDPQLADSGVSIQPDPSVAAIVKDAEQRTAKITESVIAKTASGKSITKNFASEAKAVGGDEMAAGDLVVDAQMAEAKKKGIAADLAITNGGGVRADLTAEPDGSIKWKSAQAVQPFSNQIQVFEVSGKQIYDILNSQFAKANENRYYLLSGMTYLYTDQDNANFPYKVAMVYDRNHKPIDPNKTYRVITSNYLVDSTASFKGAKKVADLGVDTDLFVDYLKDEKTIKDPQMGRKKYITVAEAAKLQEQAGNAGSSNSQSAQPELVPSSNPDTKQDPANKNTEENQEKPKQIKLTHNAFIYGKNGRRIKRRLLRKGSFIKAGKVVVIKHKKYYQIGKNEFVKLANTLSRTKTFKLRHNAFIYTRRGKAIRHGHKHLLLRKGRKIKALRGGKTITIHGKKFVMIAKGRYVKLANTIH